MLREVYVPRCLFVDFFEGDGPPLPSVFASEVLMVENCKKCLRTAAGYCRVTGQAIEPAAVRIRVERA